jgi:O-antigen/teichoic acid export membrane protein
MTVDSQPESGVSITGRSVVRGGLWQVLNAVVPQLAVFVVSIVAAHVLGNELFGEQSYISFVELTAAMLIADGLNQSMLRHASLVIGAGRPDRVRALVRWGLRWSAAISLLVAAVMAAFAVRSPNHHTAWVLASIAAVTLSTQAVPVAIAHAFHQWRRFATLWVYMGLASLAVTLFVLGQGFGIEGMFAVEVGYVLIGTALVGRLAYTCVRDVPVHPSDDPDEAAEVDQLLRSASRFAWASIFTTIVSAVVWRRTEFFFLKHYADDVQISLYSVPFALTGAIVRLPTAFTSVLGATFANFTGGDDRDRLRDSVARVVRLVISLTVPVTALVFVSSSRIIEFLYPSSFADSGPILRLMILTLPLSVLFGVCTAVLQAVGRLRVAAITAASAAVIDLGLAFVLIPRHGAMGAAGANTVAQLAACLPLVVVALAATKARVFTTRFVVANLLVALIVGGAGLVGIALVEGLAGLLIGGALAGVVLMIALPAGWVDRGDREWIADTVPFASSTPVRLILRVPRPTR